MATFSNFMNEMSEKLVRNVTKRQSENDADVMAEQRRILELLEKKLGEIYDQQGKTVHFHEIDPNPSLTLTRMKILLPSKHVEEGDFPVVATIRGSVPARKNDTKEWKLSVDPVLSMREEHVSDRELRDVGMDWPEEEVADALAEMVEAFSDRFTKPASRSKSSGVLFSIAHDLSEYGIPSIKWDRAEGINTPDPRKGQMLSKRIALLAKAQVNGEMQEFLFPVEAVLRANYKLHSTGGGKTDTRFIEVGLHAIGQCKDPNGSYGAFPRSWREEIRSIWNSRGRKKGGAYSIQRDIDLKNFTTSVKADGKITVKFDLEGAIRYVLGNYSSHYADANFTAIMNSIQSHERKNGRGVDRRFSDVMLAGSGTGVVERGQELLAAAVNEVAQRHANDAQLEAESTSGFADFAERR